MKALTLTQPWATLVAIGAKKIETRSWSTNYRGPLAIHVSKKVPREYRHLCGWDAPEPFLSALKDIFWTLTKKPGWDSYQGLADNFHLGCVIATCELVGCFPISENQLSYFKYDRVQQGEILPNFFEDQDYVWLPPKDKNELAFGDYAPGRYAWLLDNIKPLPEPIPAKGALKLWEWEPPVSDNELYGPGGYYDKGAR